MYYVTKEGLVAAHYYYFALLHYVGLMLRVRCRRWPALPKGDNFLPPQHLLISPICSFRHSPLLPFIHSMFHIPPAPLNLPPQSQDTSSSLYTPPPTPICISDTFALLPTPCTPCPCNKPIRQFIRSARLRSRKLRNITRRRVQYILLASGGSFVFPVRRKQIARWRYVEFFEKEQVVCIWRWKGYLEGEFHCH